MASDLSDCRIIPCIQLHEYETLILVGARTLTAQFPDRSGEIERIVGMANSFPSPEVIDDVDGPSKRIIGETPEYEDRKTSAGPVVVSRIGLTLLRNKCIHFGCWIGTLESLAHPTATK